MISQHPDHAGKPYWHDQEFIATHHEAEECFLSFSELGSSEYKWDWEGKLVDESVIERLLMEHFEFFQKNPLGKEKFLTFRLPNPNVETEFRIGRAFMCLMSAAGLATKVGLHSPPMFEVILPMTESAGEMIGVQEAFAEISSLKHYLNKTYNGSLKYIEIIPLFEKVTTIANSQNILQEYIKLHKKRFAKSPEYLRPYIARSDPALNSGLVPTVLAVKIALSHYRKFETTNGLKLYPIIGSASLPFRGGLTPLAVKDFVDEYRGVRTALLQSAFRYDFDKEKAIAGIQELEALLPGLQAVEISDPEERKLTEAIFLFEKFYQGVIPGIAPIINEVASKLPRRRERVQHIGLFGYSRGVGGVKLPRAIGFCGALYSLGILPELIGTGRGLREASKRGLKEVVEKYYLNLKKDLVKSGRFLNKENLLKLSGKVSAWQEVREDVNYVEDYLGIELGPETPEEVEHVRLTSKIYKLLEDQKEMIYELTCAALLRKSLG